MTTTPTGGEGRMNNDYLRLRDASVPLKDCPKCKAPFEPFLRGQVYKSFLFIFSWPFGKSSCLICRACKEIVGYE